MTTSEYLVDEARKALTEVSDESEFETALRDVLEAVLEDGQLGEGVLVRTLDEAGFMGGGPGLALKWPSGLELTLDIGVYRRS